MLKNVIFDWSGTLVDDLPAVWRTTNYVFRKAGVAELSLEAFRSEFCLPFKDFYDRYIPHVPLEELEAWFHSEFRQWEHLIAAQPFAIEFLKFCRRNRLQTLVLSTIQADYFHRHNQRLGLETYFDHSYVGVHDKRTQIQQILQRHQLEAGETCFIGDMRHDIDTAKHGGILSCAVLTGYNSLLQLRESYPDLIVAHLGELQARLEANRLAWPASSARGSHLANSGPIATVGALIFNDQGQMLLVQTPKWSSLWGIPGGKIEYGESSQEALRREVHEETGLELEDIQWAMVQDCIESPEFYRSEHFLLLNYVARCVGTSQVTLNHEACAYRWLSWVEAWALPLNQPTRILLQQVKKSGLSPAGTSEPTLDSMPASRG